MIRRQNRFHGRHSVAKVRGFLVHTDHFSMRVGKSTQSDYRLAVVVSKKIASSAVTRNRIRRRIFEAVRTGDYLAGQSIDAIIYVKDDSVRDAPWQDISNELARLCKKALSGDKHHRPIKPH